MAQAVTAEALVIQVVQRPDHVFEAMASERRSSAKRKREGKKGDELERRPAKGRCVFEQSELPVYRAPPPGQEYSDTE